METSLPENIRVVCLTGHRQIPPDHALRLPALLQEQMIALIERGAVEFRAGGALGFDMVASLKLLELKEHYPHVQLHLYLPCRDQTRAWGEAGRRAYRYLLEHADFVRYESEEYTPDCMLARDRRMVLGSDACLAYCTRNRGGSFYTCAYACKHDVPLINLADRLREKES